MIVLADSVKSHVVRHFLCCKKSLVQSIKVQYCNIEKRALSMDSRKTSVALGNIDGRILISTNNKVQINKFTKPSQFVPILISKNPIFIPSIFDRIGLWFCMGIHGDRWLLFTMLFPAYWIQYWNSRKVRYAGGVASFECSRRLEKLKQRDLN